MFFRGEGGTPAGGPDGVLVNVVNPLEEKVDIGGAVTDDDGTANWVLENKCNLEA